MARCGFSLDIVSCFFFQLPKLPLLSLELRPPRKCFRDHLRTRGIILACPGHPVARCPSIGSIAIERVSFP